jgi:hypothetical protein
MSEPPEDAGQTHGAEPAHGAGAPEDAEPAQGAGPPRRAQRGELVSAAGALLLLVLMFLFEWYGLDGIPGRSQVSTAENAWHGLTVTRWLMLLTIVVTLGSLIIHATQRDHGAKTDTSGVIAILGTLTALLLTYRVLIDTPSPATIVDQKLGAYLGVLSAIAIALGGYDTYVTGARTPAQPQSSRSRPRLAQRPEAR